MQRASLNPHSVVGARPLGPFRWLMRSASASKTDRTGRMLLRISRAPRSPLAHRVLWAFSPLTGGASSPVVFADRGATWRNSIF